MVKAFHGFRFPVPVKKSIKSRGSPLVPSLLANSSRTALGSIPKEAHNTRRWKSLSGLGWLRQNPWGL